MDSTLATFVHVYMSSITSGYDHTHHIYPSTTLQPLLRASAQTEIRNSTRSLPLETLLNSNFKITELEPVAFFSSPQHPPLYRLGRCRRYQTTFRWTCGSASSRRSLAHPPPPHLRSPSRVAPPSSNPSSRSCSRRAEQANLSAASYQAVRVYTSLSRTRADVVVGLPDDLNEPLLRLAPVPAASEGLSVGAKLALLLESEQEVKTLERELRELQMLDERGVVGAGTLAGESPCTGM